MPFQKSLVGQFLSYIGLFCVLNWLFSRITINKLPLALCLKTVFLFKIQEVEGSLSSFWPSCLLRLPQHNQTTFSISHMSVTSSRLAKVHVHPALEDSYMMYNQKYYAKALARCLKTYLLCELNQEPKTFVSFSFFRPPCTYYLHHLHLHPPLLKSVRLTFFVCVLRLKDGELWVQTAVHYS